MTLRKFCPGRARMLQIAAQGSARRRRVALPRVPQAGSRYLAVTES